MTKKTLSNLWSHIAPAIALTSAIAFTTFHAKADYLLGPLNPGFENGGADWNSGGPNDSGGSNSFDNVGMNGPSALGTNCVMMTADGSVTPSGGNDLRCNYFSLGPATAGSNSVSVDFDYNILNPVVGGNNVRIDVRFEDSNGNFLGEYLFHVGQDNNDAGGTGWHHFHGVAADPTRSAVNLDLRLSMNIFGDDIWSGGPVLFDNFAVSATPNIGVNNNGDFETTTVDWNSGGPNSSGGYNNFYNPGTNGPSAPGNNCVLMSADGSVTPSGGNDIRVNNFWLGAATAGANAVSVDFDYNILDPVVGGNNIRIDTRFENSGGGFLGETLFHIGQDNNDAGATGWHHFHGVTVDPTYSAVTMDLRMTMNIFGDDLWSSGPVLFDNFVVSETPAVGPNNNGDFEEGNANWNGGGPNNSGGFENFYYGGTNGPSEFGTNCVLMSSDGTVSPPNGNDIRVNSFTLPPNAQTLTFSFDYNILNTIASSPNSIRVGLRFFSQQGGNNYNGEFDVHPGTDDGDLGAQGWKHYTGTCTVPSGSQSGDIRVSMNIFGDDDWNNGPVLFDNFVVINGTNATPVANNVLMGTIKNLPVSRAAIANASAVPNNLLDYELLSTNEMSQATGGIIEGDGILAYPVVSYVGQPSHGTVTASKQYLMTPTGPYLIYTPNSNYVGSDSFPFAISDGLGGLTYGTATVQVNSTIGTNRFTSVTSSALSFSGAPDCDYALDETYSLTAPIIWIPVSTNSASGTGSVIFTNPPTAPAAFYRAQLLP